MKRLLMLMTVLAACGPEPLPGVPIDPRAPDEPEQPEPPRFTTFLELHAGVIARTCSPNPGVCHGGGDSYPDLSTSGTMLLAISAPCNADPPEPTHGIDACERSADHVAGEGFDHRIAWLNEEERGIFSVGLAEVAEQTGRFDVHFERDGEIFIEIVEEDQELGAKLAIELVEGSKTATVTVSAMISEAYVMYHYGYRIARVIAGDPNRNGILGAELGEPARVIAPGRLDRSYLWGRITGTVPGTRMPLANQPLSRDEYVAIACWIEGLAKTSTPAVDDPIDYEGCVFAGAPIDYSMR